MRHVCGGAACPAGEEDRVGEAGGQLRDGGRDAHRINAADRLLRHDLVVVERRPHERRPLGDAAVRRDDRTAVEPVGAERAKPLGDRPTIFCEIIQRIGCDKDDDGKEKEQAAGCGGFGKGNFSELFKSIEEFEKTLEK